MALENVQVVHLKLQMQPDVNFFEKLLKDNQAQEICKNLRIYPSILEEFVNFSKSSIPKPEDSLCFNRLTQGNAHRLSKEENNMNQEEIWNRGVFWYEKVSFRWARRLPVLLAWFKKGEATVFKKTIWRRICYGLGNIFCVRKGCSDGYINVFEKGLLIYELSSNQ